MISFLFKWFLKLTIPDKTAYSPKRIILPLAAALSIWLCADPVTKMANYTIFENVDQLESAVIEFIMDLAEKSIKERGAFLLGLSGGSLATLLGKLKFPESAEMEKWHVFLVDERAVPLDHADSNYRAIREAWNDSLECKWYPVGFDNEKLDLDRSASEYEKTIRATFEKYNTDSFDLLLLGLGPDGHTASLFPAHPDFLNNLTNDSLVIPVRDSPKPPSLRVSLTPKAIKGAKASAFIITNSAVKAPIIKSIVIDRDPQYPASFVAEISKWFLDSVSASHL